MLQFAPIITFPVVRIHLANDPSASICRTMSIHKTMHARLSSLPFSPLTITIHAANEASSTSRAPSTSGETDLKKESSLCGSTIQVTCAGVDRLFECGSTELLRVVFVSLAGSISTVHQAARHCGLVREGSKVTSHIIRLDSSFKTAGNCVEIKSQYTSARQGRRIVFEQRIDSAALFAISDGNIGQSDRNQPLLQTALGS